MAGASHLLFLLLSPSSSSSSSSSCSPVPCQTPLAYVSLTRLWGDSERSRNALGPAACMPSSRPQLCSCHGEGSLSPVWCMPWLLCCVPELSSNTFPSPFPPSLYPCKPPFFPSPLFTDLLFFSLFIFLTFLCFWNPPSQTFPYLLFKYIWLKIFHSTVLTLLKVKYWHRADLHNHWLMGLEYRHPKPTDRLKLNAVSICKGIALGESAFSKAIKELQCLQHYYVESALNKRYPSKSPPNQVILLNHFQFIYSTNRQS